MFESDLSNVIFFSLVSSNKLDYKSSLHLILKLLTISNAVIRIDDTQINFYKYSYNNIQISNINNINNINTINNINNNNKTLYIIQKYKNFKIIL